MPIAPVATICLITLPQRCRPKASRTPSALKNLNPRIRSPTRHVTTRRSWLKKKARRRKGLEGIGENVLATKKNSIQLLASILRPQKRRSGPDALIKIRKATLQMIVPNLQKNSISFDNLRAGDGN